MKQVFIKIRALLNVYIYVRNWFLLKLVKAKFEKMPSISGKLFFKGTGKIVFGKNVQIASSRYSNPIGGDTRTAFIVSSGAILLIGNNCGISNSTIFCTKRIIIEDNVLIGGGTKIYDTDFHPLDYYARINNINESISRREVIIKEGAFIGGHSIILKGVKISKQSIIGAGSVVSKDIPDFEIWAGNPAKFIKKTVTY